MKIVITGGAGFLGRGVAAALLQRPDISEVHLVDRVLAAGLADPRLHGHVVTGLTLGSLVRLLPGTGAIVHLAAAVSGQAEADFDLGMAVNLDGTRAVLEAARALGTRPRIVFASSIAVFGGAFPAMIADDTAITPTNSYGVAKAMAELLVADYSRRGYVDGRTVRLPAVVVRSGQPNAAAWGFASAIIREPLAGQAAVCPVSLDTELWVLSPARAVAGLLRALDLPAEQWGGRTALNLPGLSIRVGDMLAALAAVAGPEVAARVALRPDPRIQAIVGGVPGRFDTARGRALGFAADTDFADVIRQHRIGA